MYICVHTYTYRLHTHTKLYVTQFVKGLLDYFKVVFKDTLHVSVFLSLPLILNSIVIETILSIFFLIPPVPYIK